MSNRILRPLLAPVLLLAVASCTPAPRALPTAAHADSTVIRRDIEFLASDRLEGRLAGTPGNDSAAAYLARRYRSLGLTELAPGYLQPFDALSAQDAHMGRTAPRPTQNVVALLRGRDPALRDQYVVIGAHFDHLGRSPMFALSLIQRTWDAQRRGPRRSASRLCSAGIRRCAINTSSSAHTSITWDGRRCSPWIRKPGTRSGMERTTTHRELPPCSTWPDCWRQIRRVAP